MQKRIRENKIIAGILVGVIAVAFCLLAGYRQESKLNGNSLVSGVELPNIKDAVQKDKRLSWVCDIITGQKYIREQMEEWKQQQ